LRRKYHFIGERHWSAGKIHEKGANYWQILFSWWKESS